MARPQTQREALTAVDTAWLRMDRPSNLMMICGMLMLEAPVGLQQLRDVIRTRMLCFHRFRQRVADAAGSPYWETDAEFDLDWHVRHMALPAGDTALQEVASDLFSTPLDPARPMWQCHLIDMPGTSAVIMRIHHCYGDGFAMLHVVNAFTDAYAGRPGMAGEDLAPQQPARSAWEHVLGPVTEAAGDALRLVQTAAGIGAAVVNEPRIVRGAARTGADLLYQAAVIAGMTPDAPSRLKGKLGVIKKVAWAAPIALADIKAVAAVLGCTVNDVLVACVTGALAAYLEDQSDTAAKLDLRALVPVNLRPPGRLTELGNQFGLVFLDLPSAIGDPVQRAIEVHKRMDLLKQSTQPQVALAILTAIGVAPEPLKERLLEALAANASMVVTNVHGPDHARYLAGQRITRQLFWVPQSGGIGLGISLLSYAGQLNFGVAADARRIPDPDRIPQLFARQFEALLLAALMMPWPGDAGDGG
ncbi:wax ester/triacylglycerol synthase family O-acyltransferase [Pseudoduganella ginsengisoli]|uniref:diacylglycerol O-acyltransferase n=1 Tax=Pseudoduganella ginsengisoli TaxID=1462440 RepID=A0A6L6Q4Y5_9BURK|nr:wax ester/triacylglycerol synthase family O-acyltransferase [Pseudoduganella ginsengisoli]MTW04605.1 wax ester/triacylglycerol synthase family O-acyltransferase [Pseudoduganella ginsengisoli]